MNKPRIIAFYLPQFHPIPENDDWWGKSFTEWTNVGKAKPLFPGHRQPKVPADLGYYDLRLPEIYDEQTKLAKEAGIEGFCFWHYYFGDGKQLLEKPLKRIVQESKNDFPFCLGWANESWEKKLWNKDATGNVTLIEQKYGGETDYKRHFEIIKPIITDSRYIKVDGKPLFFIYKPRKFDDCKNFINCWRKWAREECDTDFHFVAQAIPGENDFSSYFENGFDAVFTNRIMNASLGIQSNLFATVKNIFFKIAKWPRLIPFSQVIKQSYDETDKTEKLYPGIICGWDHTPRSGTKGYLFTGFDSESFKTHIEKQISLVSQKQQEHKIIFLKSWNEWGEGNFMEPDLEFGNEKLKVISGILRGEIV